MFGYIIVNKPEMKFREFDVYHGYYCGLCRKLKEHYGKFGQITLSYDMVFVLMTSLYIFIKIAQESLDLSAFRILFKLIS